MGAFLARKLLAKKKDLDFSRPIRLNKKRELYIYNKYIIPKKLLFFIANINKTLHEKVKV